MRTKTTDHISYRSFLINLVKQTSRYNFILINGCVPHESGIMSSLSKEEQQVETNTYEPQRISFTITPSNTNISIQRSFSMLESIENQDIFKCKDEIIQTQQLALWNESTTVGVVKASVSTEYLHLIHSATTLNEI
ncbi:hypothetical protein DMUE_1881 [Dictyocoela muelleri]|nr:hypothetical protein DMUE_1881 [Dictyocoela muelleri]